MIEESVKEKSYHEPITLDPSVIKKADSWESLVSLWMLAKEADQAIQWFKGDIAKRVEIKYGKQSLKKFAQEVGESRGTIEHYRRTARAFSISKRNWNLSWTHYLIASFTDSYKKKKGFKSNNRFKWIEIAHDKNWSTGRLKEEIKKQGEMKNEKNLFEYYGEYLDKVRNILMHIEKEKLTTNQRRKLIHRLLDIYNEVLVYLGEENND